MVYKIVVTSEAEKDFEGFVRYLLLEKKSVQAGKNLIDDFEKTKLNLEHVAEALKLCDNTRLRELGYRRINFLSHKYFMLYRVEGSLVFVDNIFHELQDYENKIS